MPLTISNIIILPDAPIGSIVGTLSFTDDKGFPISCTYSMAPHPYLGIRYPNKLVILNPIIPGFYSINITATEQTTSEVITLHALGGGLEFLAKGIGFFKSDSIIKSLLFTNSSFIGSGSLINDTIHTVLARLPMVGQGLFRAN